MMSATKALEITMENIHKFYIESMKIIEEKISPKLNDAILASARNLQKETKLYLVKGEYRSLILTESKEEFFLIYLKRYIGAQKFKNVKIEPTKDYINISFSW